jgi:uncharacterized protein (TIGR02452 family)
MKKSTRAEKAQETLQIIEQGYYRVNQEVVNIKASIALTDAESILYRPEDFDTLMPVIAQKAAAATASTKIEVINTTVLDAAAAMRHLDGKKGCLNFASAKNPGGGFLGGAVAQEESLAMSSVLYGTLSKHFEMYEYNRARPTLLYSDHMIWSPDCAVMRDDNGALLAAPYPVSFITSPAVNLGAIMNNRPHERSQTEDVMMRRMDRVLGVFLHHDIRHLLLGAWGCGVFRNDPKDIARYFGSWLLNDGKYSHCFDSITFAVLDKNATGPNITAFREVFG